MVADQSNNQSVERVFVVLRAFLAGRPELRVSDIARATGIGQSTASRMLATLESLGFVARDEVSGLYRLGLANLSLASVALNHHPVHREGRQVAQDLAHRLGLGANVAVRDGATLLYLCNFEGQLSPRSHTLMGQRNPLYATGIGKCLLAGLTSEQRRHLLGHELKALTSRTVRTHDDLDTHIERIASHGYTTEIEELALGRACIAAPIRDARGEIVAALSISGPLSALNLATREVELAGQVIEAADSIATGLGFVVTPGMHALTSSAARH